MIVWNIEIYVYRMHLLKNNESYSRRYLYDNDVFYIKLKITTCIYIIYIFIIQLENMSNKDYVLQICSGSCILNFILYIINKIIGKLRLIY